MPHRKIDFKDEQLEFMSSYKDAHGVSLQRFVSEAVDYYIENKKAEQVIKDQEYLNK